MPLDRGVAPSLLCGDVLLEQGLEPGAELASLLDEGMLGVPRLRHEHEPARVRGEPREAARPIRRRGPGPRGRRGRRRREWRSRGGSRALSGLGDREVDDYYPGPSGPGMHGGTLHLYGHTHGVIADTGIPATSASTDGRTGR